jgi:hypothetical protein
MIGSWTHFKENFEVNYELLSCKSDRDYDHDSSSIFPVATDSTTPYLLA